MTSGRKPRGNRPLAGACQETGQETGLKANEEIDLMLTGLVETPSQIGAIDGKLQVQLGQTLKAMFDQVAKAPMPEKFLQLLNQLDIKEKRE